MRNLMRMALASGALLMAFAGQAQAATTIGETFDPSGGLGCAQDYTRLQTTSPANLYTVPNAGVITAWSFYAGASPPQLKLKVGRHTAGNDFQIVGDSPLKTPAPSQLNTYTDVRISVQAGDVIGQYTETGGECGRNQSGYGFHYVSGDVLPDTTTAYNDASTVNFQWDVSARLEPDADNDGFGDETQDQCPAVAAATPDGCPPPSPDADGDGISNAEDDCPARPGPAANGGCPPKDETPPETTITNVKLLPKQGQAIFEFTSSEDDSTFVCKLNKRNHNRYKPCDSPKTFRHLRKGHNTFKVIARDAAGNFVRSPAVKKFRIGE